MDGSEVSVVVLGQEGVGKTTFINHCFDHSFQEAAGTSRYSKVTICGREISIRIVDNPGRQHLVPAIMVILLFDLTQLESFKSLQRLLETAQRVSPVGLRAVVGTKADMQDNREVTTQQALDFCQKHSGSATPIPYYETSTKFSDSILLAFQEIMARPLINDYVIKTTTEQEQKIFVQEVMEWAIASNSANILTHLRDLGYPIPLDIIDKYPLVIRDYLLGEYPLQEVPRFKHLELKELSELLSWEDSSILLDDGDENSLAIQDTRPTIEVTRTFHLLWRDISLPVFLPAFLEKEAMDTKHLTHVDLSHNKLPSIPFEFFQLPLLESLDVSHNRLSSLPGIELWKCNSRLQYLNAAHNSLTEDVPPRATQMGQFISTALWYVDLSHNLFHAFPRFLLHFSLHHLDISHNSQIAYLPMELCRMTKLTTLLLHGLSLIDPPFFVVERGPEAILHYLRLKQSNQLPWSSLRVIMVGPQYSGKTTLVSKITGTTSNSNKALDVVEWRYRGNEIFSFRSRWFTFDLWDFSGDPELGFMCSSFGCQNSLHLVVCDAMNGVHHLVQQLADLQSVSEERVVVMVVFTHLDLFKTREDKEKFKKTTLQWISHHNKQGGNGSFSLMATTSVRSLHGEEMLASYEADVLQGSFEMMEVKGPDIPLMPLVLRIHFVSCVTGEGIPNLKKTLYKVASGSFSTQINPFPHSTLIVREVPYLYTHLESVLRQLRIVHRENQEGQQRVFYTLQELREQLREQKSELADAPENNLKAALRFIHQMGLIYLHEYPTDPPETLVCVDPQLIGCLLQRTVRACRVTQEANPSAYFMANTHLCMMWGVEPILNMEQDSSSSSSSSHQVSSVTSSHLLHFLQSLKVFSPLLPGAMLLTPILPHTLPRSCDPDSTSLTPRRSYVFSYLPTCLHIHLLTKVVGAIAALHDPSPSPYSPTSPDPPATMPTHLPSGLDLYLWQKNLFVCVDGGETRVWLRVREEDIGLDPLPHCGRIDICVAGSSLQTEARWLRLITLQMDKLLEEVYPCLLDPSRPQKVEVFVPLSHQEPLDDCVLENSNESQRVSDDSPFPAEPKLEMERATADDKAEAKASSLAPEQSSRAHGGTLSPVEKRLAAGTASGQSSSTPSSGQSSSTPSSRRYIRKISEGMSSSSPLSPSSASSRGAKFSNSWEVVSKYSTTSNRFSILPDQSDPDFDLIPLWECLQEAFRTPVVRVDNTRLTLSNVIPDLLFADLPPEMLFRTKVSSPDHFLVSLEERIFGGVAPPPPEASGMFVEPYYSFDDADVFIRKPAGALKAFYLQSCLSSLREDLLKLQKLQCSYLVSPVGVQYCPPSLALEAAPFGSLRAWMRRLRRRMNRGDTHHISLQLLKALDFFHSKNITYHAINSDNILVWNLNPLVVKLSHSGITHPSRDCELCVYLDSLPAEHSLRRSYRFDYMLLGLLVYEMATGKRPFENIYSLNTVALSLLHGNINLNVEADHFLQKRGQKVGSEEECIATGCQRLCLQSSIDHCLQADPISHRELEAQFSLCAGDHLWSPMRLLVNVEVMISSMDSEMVYWASGSRGLVTGTMLPSTGELTYNILQEAPPPESGHVCQSASAPVPIAVGRASGLALVQETKQLWVGTENGQMGSVYVFNLPDMRRHHHIHLQDAVLTLCAVNHLAEQNGGPEMRYRVLVGLANGTIIVFLGQHGEKVLDNPLQGPKLVLATHQRRPCLTMTLTSRGRVWCSCGNTMEVYDIPTLKLVQRLSTAQVPAGGKGGVAAAVGSRGDVITLMTVSGRGVWTVGRRSPVLRLWDHTTGQYRANFDVSGVVHSEDEDITSMAVSGGSIWLGTRNGYLVVLDSYLMVEGKDPLLGVQKCGAGKVKCIVPLVPLQNAISKLQVMCSLEFPDEVSCHLLTWEYFCSANHKGSTPLDQATKISSTLPDLLDPDHTHSSESKLQHCKSF